MNKTDVNTPSKFTPEQKVIWKLIKAPHYEWAKNKSFFNKHTPGLKDFLETLVTCSDENGLCSVGLQAIIKRYLYDHARALPERTAKSYIATLKKQKLIWKYELKHKWVRNGKSGPQKRYNTWATRLNLGTGCKKCPHNISTERIYHGEVVSSKTAASPSTMNQKNKTNRKAANAPPLGSAPGVLAAAELDREPRPLAEYQPKTPEALAKGKSHFNSYREHLKGKK